ncbi:MAG TPA: hypothetical protein PKK48_09080, partial [Phycisphaerae bacterium]|nr:hypothetical protein [Phycisphaerae bacterium]
VSDHGLLEVTKHFHVDDFLQNTLKLDVAQKHRREKHPLAERQAYYNQYPCVTYGNGDRFWAVSLRKPAAEAGKFEPWNVRPTEADMRNYPNRANARIDVIARFIAESAVDVVAWADGNGGVNVATRGGQVTFRQPDGNGAAIEYKVVHGTDPLDWGRYGIKDGQKLLPREWMERTHETSYPGLPADICAYFRCKRCGDIALFAMPGYDFNNVHRAGHGGLRPGEMFVPLIIAGPGIAQQKIKYARTIDVVPTILELLGKSPMQVDGKALPLKKNKPQNAD